LALALAYALCVTCSYSYSSLVYRSAGRKFPRTFVLGS